VDGLIFTTWTAARAAANPYFFIYNYFQPAAARVLSVCCFCAAFIV